MDVLEFLTDEHDEAKAVFRKLEKAKGPTARRLFDQLKSMLTLHEELEETFFYPPSRTKRLPKTSCSRLTRSPRDGSAHRGDQQPQAL